jgi:hypothetical protein
VGAITYEIIKRREQARAELAQKRAKVAERADVETTALPSGASASA